MYTEFEETEKGLIIRLNNRGRDELEELKTLHKEKGCLAIWWDLNEGMFCNGYHDIRPELIGALTDSPIISDTLFDEETGPEEKDHAKIWWFPEYQLVDEVEELLTKGEIIFTKV